MSTPTETQGRDAVWLLQLEIGGGVLRYASQQVSTTRRDGTVVSWAPGLAPVSVELGSDLDEVGIEIEGGEDWPALYAQGAPLALASGTLYHWYVGTVIEDARTVLVGTLRDLQLGAVGEERYLVASLGARTVRPSLWPPSTWIIDSTTWNDSPSVAIIDDKVKGAAYPIPIGYPGTGDDDLEYGIPAAPALLCRYVASNGAGNTALMIAGGHIEASSIELIRMDKLIIGAATKMRAGSVAVVKSTDLLGQEVSIVNFGPWAQYLVLSAAGNTLTLSRTIGAGEPAAGTVYMYDRDADVWEELAYNFITGAALTLVSLPSFTINTPENPLWFAGHVQQEIGGEYWASFRSSEGGGISYLGETPLRSLGAVIIYALQRSGERVDMTRALAEIGRLKWASIDTVLSGRDDLAAWVDGDLAPIFPIIRAQSSAGVYYRLLDFTATASDSIHHFDLDAGPVKVSGAIEISTDSIANSFSIEYAPATMDAATRRVRIGPTHLGLVDDARILRDERCAISASRYGELEGDQLVAPHVFSDSTAYEALRHKAARDALPRITLEIEGVDLNWAEIGDVVTVKLASMGWTRQVAIVLSVTIEGAWFVLELEIVDDAPIP